MAEVGKDFDKVKTKQVVQMDPVTQANSIWLLQQEYLNNVKDIRPILIPESSAAISTAQTFKSKGDSACSLIAFYFFKGTIAPF